jgi:transcriptional regulator with XRE-family HTH domain
MKKLSKLRPSPVAERIRARMTALGLSQAELARRAKLTPVLLSELLRGATQSVKHDNLIAIAAALNTTADELAGLVIARSFRPAPRANPDVPRAYSQEEIENFIYEEQQYLAEREAHKNTSMPQMFRRQKNVSFRAPGSIEMPIPLYSEAESNLLVIKPSAEGNVDRPPLLLWVDGAYAVIADGSMSPRYNSGEILYVAPGTAVRDGDYAVVVTRREGEANLLGRICRLKALTYAYALVEALSPQSTETISLDTVAHIHRIVLSGQQSLD